MEACLDSLEALWRKLGLPPAWWVGYSMGGRTALQLAVRKPALVAGLVLESATPGLEDAAQRAERVQADQALADFILAEGVAAFVERWLALPLFAGLRRLPPEQQAAQRALRLAHSAAGLAGSLRGMGTGAMEPVWNQLEEVAVPTLLLVGEEDEKFVEIARRMADKMARSTLRIVPQAGHTLHAEAQAAYLAAVNEFFASSGATP
jgi:2-succinyl-6-hydroxy-2,4-cyclohexadiene-1-carboxylate synthase